MTVHAYARTRPVYIYMAFYTFYYYFYGLAPKCSLYKILCSYHLDQNVFGESSFNWPVVNKCFVSFQPSRLNVNYNLKSFVVMKMTDAMIIMKY